MGKSWLADLAARFHSVVMVLGNHDYWGCNVDHLVAKYRGMIDLQGLTNVHLLDGDMVMIDGIGFMGATLWTDLDRSNPLVRYDFDHLIGGNGRYAYNDRNHIRSTNHYHRFSSSDWFRMNQLQLSKLTDLLDANTDVPVVLVTHHAPLRSVIEPEYINDPSNAFYASDFQYQLIRDNVVAMIHGHIHSSIDTMAGDVRVLRNPRGYEGREMNHGFDPFASFTL